MIKSIFVISFILFSSFCFAQEKPDNAPRANQKYLVAQAGHELKAASSQYYLGIGLTLSGALLGATSGEEGPALAGGLLMLTGTIISIISHHHLGKAGKYLIEATYSYNTYNTSQRIEHIPVQYANAGVYIPLNKIRDRH